MKTFYKLLANNLVASVTNFFVWFALTFFVYLETRSVLATSVIAGAWAVLSAATSMLFGTYVDHHKKKQAMFVSSLISFAAFSVGALLYLLVPKDTLLPLSGLPFWAFVFFLMTGTIAGNMRGIAISTCVTLLVPEKDHDKANGLVGSVSGVVFSLTSIFGGLGIGFIGMGWSLLVAVCLTAAAALHVLTISIPEKKIVHLEEAPKRADFKGAIKAIRPVPGLMALIFFATINNFLGGVFMSLMDAYGLSLVSVEAWGLLWGALSLGIIAGGMYVSKKGLGKNPVRTIIITNVVLWTVTILFPLRNSIILLAIGMLIYMFLMPMVEASEQTVIQKVVPLEKQGRVFGFGQTVEQAAAPITAFLIGPLAQFVVIPAMEDGGSGARVIGSWFGVGASRGMALIFVVAGIFGLALTLLALRSKSYTHLSRAYLKPAKQLKTV